MKSMKLFPVVADLHEQLNEATLQGNVELVNFYLSHANVTPNNGTLLKAYIANNDALINLYKNQYNLAISRGELNAYARENGHIQILRRLANNPNEGVGQNISPNSLRP